MIKMQYDMDSKFTFRVLVRNYQKRLIKVVFYGLISLILLWVLISIDAHVIAIGAGYGTVLYYIFSFSSLLFYYRKQSKLISKDMKNIEFEMDDEQFIQRFSDGVTSQVSQMPLNQVEMVRFNPKGLWIKCPKVAIIVMNGTFSEGSYDALIQKLQALPNVQMKKI